jgi:OmpA-OmpF porin, OOP family
MNKLSIVTLLACLSQMALAADINVYKEDVVFPDIKKSNFFEYGNSTNVGRVVNKDNIKSIAAGQDKKQVTYLLDRPHFTTGLFAVREWNYVFNFKLIDDSDMVCQYQIKFDDNMLVSASYFSSQACVNESRTNVSFDYITQSSVLRVN